MKGSPSRTDTATIRHTLPDSQHKDKFSIARGDVPVWLVNSNIVKDAADAKLRRAEPGGMIHFPTWAQDWLYAQLTNEVRDADKGWLNPNNKRKRGVGLAGLLHCRVRPPGHPHPLPRLGKPAFVGCRMGPE